MNERNLIRNAGEWNMTRGWIQGKFFVDDFEALIVAMNL